MLYTYFLYISGHRFCGLHVKDVIFCTCIWYPSSSKLLENTFNNKIIEFKNQYFFRINELIPMQPQFQIMSGSSIIGITAYLIRKNNNIQSFAAHFRHSEYWWHVYCAPWRVLHSFRPKSIGSESQSWSLGPGLSLMSISLFCRNWQHMKHITYQYKIWYVRWAYSFVNFICIYNFQKFIWFNAKRADYSACMDSSFLNTQLPANCWRENNCRYIHQRPNYR